MALYQPPANINDFARSTADQLPEKWHQLISDTLQPLTSGGSTADPEWSPLFYDQLADASGVPDSPPVGIPWNGFPLRLHKWYGPGTPDEVARMYRSAEQVIETDRYGYYRRDEQGQYVPLTLPHRIQDEYCEWHVDRAADGRVTRMSFTCEPPEYWSFLATHDFPLVHRLYEELLQRTVPPEELQWPFDVYSPSQGGYERVFEKGSYNPLNEWNTRRGAVHLTHPANSLGAEIKLASDSSLGWPVGPEPDGSVDAQKLMGCAGVGGINRSSDPLILQGVFEQARQNVCVALANPIGLYMNRMDFSLTDPDGNSIRDEALQVKRGNAADGRMLRIEIAPPTGAAYSLDECLLDGRPLRYGGQVARLITMTLFGVFKQIPGRTLRRFDQCRTMVCTHPTRPEFKGTFPVRLTCDQVTEAYWKRAAYDIPADEAPAVLAAKEALQALGTDSGNGVQARVVGRNLVWPDEVLPQ